MYSQSAKQRENICILVFMLVTHRLRDSSLWSTANSWVTSLCSLQTQPTNKPCSIWRPPRYLPQYPLSHLLQKIYLFNTVQYKIYFSIYLTKQVKNHRLAIKITAIALPLLLRSGIQEMLWQLIWKDWNYHHMKIHEEMDSQVYFLLLGFSTVYA